MNESRSRVILVLGMHRSGTSALTGVLSLLGADSGTALISPHAATNPNGFWEHADILSIHDQLLTILGSSWDDERQLPELWWKSPALASLRQRLLEVIQRDFSESGLWILKDPRLCRLLPLWLDILHETGNCTPHFVFSLRHPLEVAKSLENRDQIPEHSACLLWLEHLIEAERWTQGYPRVAVSYGQLLVDWKSVIAHVSKTLNIPISTDNPAIAEEINRFLEPSLRHHHGSQLGTNGSTWAQLALQAHALVSAKPPDQWAKVLSPFADKVQHTSTQIAPWTYHSLTLRKQMQELQSNNAYLEQTNIYLHSELDRIKSTISWQITKPLRLIANLSRHIRNVLRKS